MRLSVYLKKYTGSERYHSEYAIYGSDLAKAHTHATCIIQGTITVAVYQSQYVHMLFTKQGGWVSPSTESRFSFLRSPVLLIG